MERRRRVNDELRLKTFKNSNHHSTDETRDLVVALCQEYLAFIALPSLIFEEIFNKIDNFLMSKYPNPHSRTRSFVLSNFLQSYIRIRIVLTHRRFFIFSLLFMLHRSFPASQVFSSRKNIKFFHHKLFISLTLHLWAHGKLWNSSRRRCVNESAFR